jgi:alanine racemase
MPRPIRASFAIGAFHANLAAIRRRAAAARVWAVIKANAYGHGLARAATGLADADGFALLDLDEAVRLRDLGVTRPILLLEGFFAPEDLATFAALGLTAVVHSEEQIAMLAAARVVRPVDVLLKLNTGMNRLGFAFERCADVFARLRDTPAVGSVAFMTHFADADGPSGVAAQLARFEDATRGLPGARSLANSAATLRYPETHADWVRPGIALYGCSPFPDESAEALGLSPVMTLASEIIAVQNLRPGDRVGYGGTFTATTPMRVGIVACGYADGYPRHAPSGTPLLVDGQRTRTVGRVSMDMLVADVSLLPVAGVGSRVTLWGDGLSCDEVATAAGTVSYELLCALAARVPQSDRS